MGDALRAQGDLKGAAKACERAELVLGPESPDRYLVTHCLGQIALERKEPQKAHQLFLQDLRTSERTFGPENWELAFPLIGLGRSLLAMGDAKGAQQRLRRALQLLEKLEGFGEERATAQFALARALDKLGFGEEARALAQTTLSFYAGSEGRYEKGHQALLRWLSGRRFPPRSRAPR